MNQTNWLAHKIAKALREQQAINELEGRPNGFSDEVVKKMCSLLAGKDPRTIKKYFGVLITLGYIQLKNDRYFVPDDIEERKPKSPSEYIEILRKRRLELEAKKEA